MQARFLKGSVSAPLLLKLTPIALEHAADAIEEAVLPGTQQEANRSGLPAAFATKQWDAVLGYVGPSKVIVKPT